MSSEHFTVDGTLIDAWASLESFKKKGAQDNPEAKLARKGRGKEAKLSFSAHALMERTAVACSSISVSRMSRPSSSHSGAKAPVVEHRPNGTLPESGGDQVELQSLCQHCVEHRRHGNDVLADHRTRVGEVAHSLRPR